MKFNEKTKELLLQSLVDEPKSVTVQTIEKLVPDEVLDYICGALEDPTCSADLAELRDIVAPHLVDVGLLLADDDAATLDWLRALMNKLFDAGVIAQRVGGGAGGAIALLDAPVDISADGADERNLFIDREDRAAIVDQAQLQAQSEKYLKRKQLRQEKQMRLDEKKKAASLEALRSLQEEQQKCKFSVCLFVWRKWDLKFVLLGRFVFCLFRSCKIRSNQHHWWFARHQTGELFVACRQGDVGCKRQPNARLRPPVRFGRSQRHWCKCDDLLSLTREQRFLL
jgi:hypothetical protein